MTALLFHIAILFLFCLVPRAMSAHLRTFRQALTIQLKKAGTLLLSSSLGLLSLRRQSAWADESVMVQSLESIDFPSVKGTINTGRVAILDNFLSPEMVQLLRDDIDAAAAAGAFLPSGLSNRANSSQQFSSTKDRSITPVLGVSGYTSPPLRLIESHINSLRRRLAVELNRPSIADDSRANQHEIYYSRSTAGARLPRHLDEHHEETKGRLGYTSSSRRSLSWLIYLSDLGWDYKRNGGQLRTFPISKGDTQRAASTSTSTSTSSSSFGGSHEGNLQVAWLRPQGDAVMHAVYLDSFKPSREGPSCGLYIVRDFDDEKGRGAEDSRIWVTTDFELRDSTGAYDSSVLARSLLPRYSPSNLFLIEDLDLWKKGEDPAGSEIVDVNPTPGRLVIFDSVTLPHEVMPVVKGRRLALAGWIHERCEFPGELTALQSKA